jgi:2-methylisocitrate lyase-like PEP mutase family enzyme
MSTQKQKAETFRALHARAGAFVIPNPYDVGTAKILAQLGYEALATTSAGYAFTIGKPDMAVGREAMMAHVKTIVDATDLPVSADLENGYGDAPKFVAQTIRLAAEAGLAGCSIEDATGRKDDPIYAFDAAVERMRAAAEAARGLTFPFTLTGRCENYLHGRPDLTDTIKRLQAYQDAGADVLYAPGLRNKDDIAAVVTSVDRPVNVVMGLVGAKLSVADLAALGVKRISVGGSLSRAALGAFLRAAKEIRATGTFTYAEEAVPSAEINGMFR